MWKTGRSSITSDSQAENAQEEEEEKKEKNANSYQQLVAAPTTGQQGELGSSVQPRLVGVAGRPTEVRGAKQLHVFVNTAAAALTR